MFSVGIKKKKQKYLFQRIKRKKVRVKEEKGRWANGKEQIKRSIPTLDMKTTHGKDCLEAN